MWAYLFASSTTMLAGQTSIVNLITTYKLDGIDLDIEYYNTDPTIVATWIQNLRKAIGSSKRITIAPECVGIYTGVTYTPGSWQAWNYWVPIINSTIQDIDYVMVQAYNNWYEEAAGTLAYIQDVYTNWRNIPNATFCNWCTAIPNFNGVPPEKLVIGLLASTSAGNAGYYVPASTIASFIQWLPTLTGIMFWDSHWDSLNGYSSSNAVAEASLSAEDKAKLSTE